MLAKIHTAAVVGLPDATVRESKERIRSAIKNTQLAWPQTRITQTVVFLRGAWKAEPTRFDPAGLRPPVLSAAGDLSEVKGQAVAKRALEVAVILRVDRFHGQPWVSSMV